MDYKPVWVKYGGWPLWPCRLANECEVGPKMLSSSEGGQTLVKFFGTPDEYAWVDDGDVKKFSTESIHQHNPLFRTLSDRKLYEAALREVVDWIKTPADLRVVPIWKPGDEDGSASQSMRASQDYEEDGSVNDYDYVDVGTVNVESDISEDSSSDLERKPKSSKPEKRKLEITGDNKDKREDKKREKNLNSDEKQKSVVIPPKHASKPEKLSEEERPNKINPPPPSKKRPLDLVLGNTNNNNNFSNSPKKHRESKPDHNNNNNNNNNNNKIKDNHNNITKDKMKERTKEKIKVDNNNNNHDKRKPANAIYPASFNITNDFEEETKTTKTTKHQHKETTKPSSPPKSTKHLPPKISEKQQNKEEKINKTLQLELNGSDDEATLKDDTEPQFAISTVSNNFTNFPVDQNNDYNNDDTTSNALALENIIKNDRDNNNNNFHAYNSSSTVPYVDESFVPDTQTQGVMENIVKKIMETEKLKWKRYFAEKMDKAIQNAMRVQEERTKGLIDEKLQTTVDKIWDQQNGFEESIKNEMRNENSKVKQEIKSLQNELDTNMQIMEDKNKNVVRSVVELLKETVVKLEHYCN